MKHVHGEIIQRKMSWGNSMGGNFQRAGGYCPAGKYLGVIVRGFGGSYLRGNYSGVIVRWAKVQGVIVLWGIS